MGVQASEKHQWPPLHDGNVDIPKSGHPQRYWLGS
jgi:hypothetical protein